ncbi:PQQ-binding-like beta-propeller repeat protein [Hephaestia sp. GCM10023244]|uniref:outer membrane protein assembly factor BamB family protein n=1 Tax=unclassified Hephaestia TaxID=2631281 RepID=UPI002077001E|nr:PQQ-binding-like beta-propeller repeat protein [Hephaestia sp. MAHUQ-44]MCM8730792.1 PQQ-binding-like beta-propeller repeat protein [Hephaestia sp. MAHUQ-44]
MIKRMKAPAVAMALLALSGCGIFKGGGKKTPTVGDRVPILVTEDNVSPDAALQGVEVLLPAPAANAAWSQPGGNAAKSMGHLALGGSLARAWTAQIEGGSNRQRLAASPAVADGRVYAIDVNAVVHAFSADNGALLWKRQIATGDQNASARFGGGVSVDNGTLYATDGLGDVVALKATDGTEVWRARPGGPLRGAPSIGNGNVYVLSQDNQLYALSQATGKIAWTESASLESQGVFGVAAPAVAQGSIVAGFSSGELNAYRYENGRTLWQDALSRTTISTSVSSLADIDADPVIDRGRVYAVGQGGRMVAIQLDTGQRLWEQDFAGIATPWVVGEWVFVVTDDARLIALSSGSGKIRWLHQLRHFKNEKKSKGLITWTGPVLAGNRLILGNSEGDVVFASPQTGEEIGRMAVGDAITLSPVVASNTLYILDHSGRISAFR